MIRIDGGQGRVALWVGSTLAVVIAAYSAQLFALVSGLSNLLVTALGSPFPAIPFFVLLIILTSLRWKEFHSILKKEKWTRRGLKVRLAGLSLVFLPYAAWRLGQGWGASSDYLAIELSAVTLILVAYGMMLTINPGMARIMLPYALLYGLGLVSPLEMLYVFGGPLADVASYLTAGLVKVAGINVLWQGEAFQFMTRGGETISAYVSPACSAAYSISVFLGLVGLMYLDMRKDTKLTAALTIAGLALLPLVNSARIAIDIWSGFVWGSSLFWAVHDWLGYVSFFAFYMVTLLIYSRLPGPAIGAKSAPGFMPGPEDTLAP